jgi:hypothetical protein
MTALFADTFYWIALADTNDSAHRLALTLTTGRAASQIVTTDEVLTEIPQFFLLRAGTVSPKGRARRRKVVDEFRCSRGSPEPGLLSFRSATLR